MKVYNTAQTVCFRRGQLPMRVIMFTVGEGVILYMLSIQHKGVSAFQLVHVKTIQCVRGFLHRYILKKLTRIILKFYSI